MDPRSNEQIGRYKKAKKDFVREDGLGRSTGLQYLPNPQPWKRGEAGNAEFFSSHPECFHDRGFFSYGQFWQAHQPIVARKPTMRTVSSSFWPFGQRITCLTGSDRKEDLYALDNRIIDRSAPEIPRSRSLTAIHKYTHQDKLAKYEQDHGTLAEQELGIKAKQKFEFLGPDPLFQEQGFEMAGPDTDPNKVLSQESGARGQFYREAFGRSSSSSGSSRSRSSTTLSRNSFTR